MTMLSMGSLELLLRAGVFTVLDLNEMENTRQRNYSLHQFRRGCHLGPALRLPPGLPPATKIQQDFCEVIGHQGGDY